MSKPIYYKSWDELPVVLTLADCAIVLQMRHDTLRKWAKAGKFPAEQVGESSEWRIDKEVFRDFVQGKVKAS